MLANLLTKREFLYKEYFFNKGYRINLPKYLTSSPSNSLFKEVRSGYKFYDPSTFSTEISRDLFYQNIDLVKLNLLKQYLRSISNTLGLNTSLITNSLFTHLFNIPEANKLNVDIYRNQYRPMKKGITNMIRLHATGAIAMPVEVRLHILASSKDVIHS
jgi:hypothetical protein